MVVKKGRAHVRLAFVLAIAGLAAPLQAAPPVHVVRRGDPLEQDVAYVVLVPHLRMMGNSKDTMGGVIVGATVDGLPREYAFEVFADRPTLVRMAPGRYHFSEVDIGPYHWAFPEDQSLFDAKPGQMNYPGDWNVTIDNHDIVRNSRTIGWRIDAALWVSQSAVDVARLALDAEFTASLKPAYTHADPPPAHPGGIGER